jgi:hypothetical protein
VAGNNRKLSSVLISRCVCQVCKFNQPPN